jgi:integrase/recombinase XerD
MFTTLTGRRWDRNGAHDTITRIGQRARITLHPHLLRHTATLALDAGAPLDRVQDLLGHADPRTTMRYAHARQRLDTSAAYDLARWLAGDQD